VEDLKISPDCSLVALGAHQGNQDVQILSVSKDDIKSKLIIKARISSALTHLDWSDDSSTIIINSQAYELLFFSV